MLPSLAVMLGGAVGALLRYAVGQALPYAPWTTLGINWLGCFILGFFLIITMTREGQMRIPNSLRLAISTGVLGGFTTFSTFSVETLTLLQKGDLGRALGYVLASLLGGVVLAWLGTLAARQVQKAGERA